MPTPVNRYAAVMMTGTIGGWAVICGTVKRSLGGWLPHSVLSLMYQL